MTAHVEWEVVCKTSDLIAESGIAVWTKAGPIALFYLPYHSPEVLAISHTDPFTGQNVLARGITGDLKGRTVVASPLYKQHFDLETGECLEDDSVSVATYQVLVDGDDIRLGIPVKSPKAATETAAA